MFFRGNVRIQFHSFSDHKKTSFAQMMAAPFVETLITNAMLDLSKGCREEGILPRLLLILNALNMKTTALKHEMQVILGNNFSLLVLVYHDLRKLALNFFFFILWLFRWLGLEDIR